MSCLDYNKTWETMNGLEVAFNKIQALEGMIQYLQSAIDADDTQVVKETAGAIADYLSKFIEEYDEASKRAWNNTVLKLEKPKERTPMDEYDEFENPVGHLNPL
jgi:hypothetical protein|tara:strand:+ start:350 stop:661 length:312 start_codon:yes stop_codon:yes gene_type:complete